MSNYKNEILANNNDLQNILTKIDELPAPGIDINGVIEEYKVAAGENISAGDFISWYDKGFNKRYINIPEYRIYNQGFSAIKINSNQVFIIYYNSSYNYPYGLLLTFNRNDVKASENKIIHSLAGSYYYKMILRSDNKIILVYSYNNNNTYLGYLTITFSGETYTIGSTNILSTTKSIGTLIHKAVDIGDNRWFVPNTISTFSGAILTVNSNDTLSLSGTTQLITSNNRSNFNCFKLNNNKIIVLYNSPLNSYYYLYGIVITINGSALSAGSEILLIDTQYAGSGDFDSVVINDNKMLITHNLQKDFMENYLMGSILTINGTSLSISGSVQLSPNDYDGDPHQILVASNGSIYIAHGNANGTINLTEIEINNDIISVKKTNKGQALFQKGSSSSGLNIIQTDDEVIRVMGLNSDSYMNISNFYPELLVIPSQGEVKGIAKTSASNGETIFIYKPEDIATEIFYINDGNQTRSYEVIKGMSWSEWIVSDYNIHYYSLTVSDTTYFYVYCSETYNKIYIAGQPETSIIQPGTTYSF